MVLKRYVDNVKILVFNNNKLFENLSYLSFLQVFNLLIPLITYPYLIHVLGSGIYGLIVFAQAIVNYFLILVSFGFNLSATKQISVHRDNPNKVREIFCSVLVIKGTFFLLSLALIGFTVYLLPQSKNDYLLYYLSAYICFYDFLFPIWYFQGYEKMKYITLINIFTRVLFLLLIFFLVKDKADYLKVPLINGIGSLVAIGISLYIVIIKDGVQFYLPKFNTILFYFKDSVTFFISNLSIQFYVNTNKVLVGTFLGMTDVAYYDLAEKILNILKMPIVIIGQTIFPKVSREKNINFIRKSFITSVSLNFVIFIITLVFAKIPILILGGSEMISSANVLRILAITVPVIAMSNIYGIQILISFGYQKEFTKVILQSGIVYLAVFGFFYALNLLGLYYIALMTVITEFFVTYRLYVICKKKKLLW